MKHLLIPSLRIFALTVALAVSTASTMALTHNGERLQFGISDGLSNGYVTSMAEDSRHRVWVATESGLNRFDGVRFITYNKTNSGLPANELNRVVQDAHDPNILWVSTQRDGVCYITLNDDSIHPHQPDFMKEMAVTSITPSARGGMWFTDYHQGLRHFDLKTGKAGVYSMKNISGFPINNWTAVEAPDGKVYVGHVHDGFSVLDTVAHSFVNYRMDNSRLPGNTVYCVTVADNGFVWLGTDKGAALFNPYTTSFIPFTHDDANPGSIASGAVRSIRRLNDGSLAFASSRGGTSILHANDFSYDRPESARFSTLVNMGRPGLEVSPNVRDVMEDSFGNIWVGNYRSGVTVISHIMPMFRQLDYTAKSPTGMYKLAAWSAAVTPDGHLWVGGEGEITEFDGTDWIARTLPGSDESNKVPVDALLATSGSRLVAATVDRGAFLYDTERKAFSQVKGLPSQVRCIYKDPMLGVLFGTNNGIWRLDGETAIHLEIEGKMEDIMIQSMQRDPAGNLWLGTFGKGLAFLTPDLKVKETLTVKDGFPSNAVNEILRDSKGRMWVATRNGLVLFPNTADLSDQKLVVDPRVAGVSHVRAIFEDKSGRICATSDNGVILINGDDLSIYSYESNAKFQLNSFMERGICSDSDGRLYLSSANGIFQLDQFTAADKADDLRVGVSGITVLKDGLYRPDSEIRMPMSNGEVKLPYNQSSFRITFSLPDIGMMGNCRFAYNMEGLNDVWIDARGDNAVIFRNLAPGTYRFRVRYSFKGGEWTQPDVIATIRILPPWYLSWWALSLYVILAAALAYTLIWLYVRRVRLKERLDAEVRENSNRQQLNEERLRFFTNITHELRTPLTLILGPIEDMVSDPTLPSKYSTKLQMIRESSNSLLSLINGILEFRKTETQNRDICVARDNISNMVYEIGLRYSELNMNREVEFRLDIDRNAREIYFDREMVAIMLNNILSNAVKYTKRGSITISLHQLTRDGAERTEISVADTGYGMKKEYVEKVFQRYYQINGEHQASGTGIGLALLKNLADLHQAEILVESEEGKGSTFTISFLTDNIYPNASHSEPKKTPTSVEQQLEERQVEKEPERTRVLLVEDNENILEYIRQSLMADYDVVTATNGLEGLKAVHDTAPAIVVSDVMMPEMDGVTMCAHIKEDILTSHIPVILLTAKDSVQDRETGYESGADSYLTKPFSAKLLRGRIANLLSQRRRLAKSLVNETIGTDSDEAATDNPTAAEPKEELHLSQLDRKFLDKVNEYIMANLADPELDVPQIAEKMCMSYSTLYRKSKSILGISMLEYIKGIRLAKAKKMIEEGEMKISEIAFAVGYNAPSSFGKIFRKEFGMSPTEYAVKAGSKIKA